jgi:hypothetical protein
VSVRGFFFWDWDWGLGFRRRSGVALGVIIKFGWMDILYLVKEAVQSSSSRFSVVEDDGLIACSVSGGVRWRW